MLCIQLSFTVIEFQILSRAVRMYRLCPIIIRNGRIREAAPLLTAEEVVSYVWELKGNFQKFEPFDQVQPTWRMLL